MVDMQGYPKVNQKVRLNPTHLSYRSVELGLNTPQHDDLLKRL